MKAFFTLAMILEIEDLPGVEDMRKSMERQGWESMIDTVKATLAERGEEFSQQVVDDSILFYGVQAWPLPHHAHNTGKERD